jgi:transposase InsO family protein
MVAHRRERTLAERFIHETRGRQGIDRGQFTIHADRGPAMTSKSVALLLTDLGVTKAHARPHMSNDNPFSEAQFKTSPAAGVPTKVRINAPNTLLRSHAASNARLSDLPTRAPSRSLPSIAAQS